jgi:site-specific recombinase XerD
VLNSVLPPRTICRLPTRNLGVATRCFSDYPPLQRRCRSRARASCCRWERNGPFTPDAVNRLIKRIGERAGFPFMVHAHMLGHACGYALANAGHDTRALQDWLGHTSIQHTVRYTELAPTRFRNFWR